MGEREKRSRQNKPKTVNGFSLVPNMTRNEKSLFNARFATSDRCQLSLEKCKAEHKTCLDGLYDLRGKQHARLLIVDPRYKTPRPCTSHEAYWWLQFDPRSIYSENYGKAGFPYIETIIAQYTMLANDLGYFQSKISKPKLDRAFATDNPHKNVAVKEFVPAVDTIVSTKPIPIPDEPTPPPKTTAKTPAPKTARNAKMTDIIRWVAENISEEIELVDLDLAPAKSACALLTWARNENDKFFTVFFAKLIPSQRELDDAAKLSDNAGKSFPILDAILNGANQIDD